MKKSNIVLVGFMGAGKSVTSEIVAGQLGLEHVSTDAAIVEREGRSINQIFAQNGETYFRDVETRVIKEMSGRPGQVIDCGGGVVLRSENLSALKERGLVVYLKTSPAVVYDRVKRETHRPLLKVTDPLTTIQELMGARTAFYAQADCEVLTDGKTAQDVAREVIRLWEDCNDPGTQQPGANVTGSGFGSSCDM